MPRCELQEKESQEKFKNWLAKENAVFVGREDTFPGFVDRYIVNDEPLWIQTDGRVEGRWDYAEITNGHEESLNPSISFRMPDRYLMRDRSEDQSLKPQLLADLNDDSIRSFDTHYPSRQKPFQETSRK